METVLAVLFPFSILILALSAVAVPVAVLCMSRRWWTASPLARDPLLRGATIWIAFGLVISALGTLAGLIGLLFAALWCVLLVVFTAFEKEAAGVGMGSPRWRTVLIAILDAQGGSALLLGALLLGTIVVQWARGVMGEGSNPFYALLGIQFGFSVTAVGAISVFAAWRLRAMRSRRAQQARQDGVVQG